MSDLKEFIKGLLRGPETITNRVIDVAKKYDEKPKNKDEENKIIGEILKIVEESTEPSETVLKEAIIAVCNSEYFSDSVTLKLLTAIFDSEKFSSKTAVTALNSKESNVSDGVIKSVIDEYAKGFKPSTRIKLLEQIGDSKTKTESIKVLLDLVYDECAEISDEKLVDRIKEINSNIPINVNKRDIRDINTKIRPIPIKTSDILKTRFLIFCGFTSRLT